MKSTYRITDRYQNKEGKTIIIAQMDDNHLQNAIEYFKKKFQNRPDSWQLPGLIRSLEKERDKRITQDLQKSADIPADDFKEIILI